MKPNELESLALKDILVYGINFIDLLENKQWEVYSRPWAIETYQVVNPYIIERHPVGEARRMVVMKSTQCGISTNAIVRAFHFADFWPTRGFYMLPRQQDVSDFVATRVTPMIYRSPRLARKIGDPDSAHVKNLEGSYIFFMESSVEPRMMPTDVVFVDEVDLSDQTNIATAQNRQDASNWKLQYFFSTPTVPNYGIHGLYLSSDMRRWVVRCCYCGHDQVLDWNQNLAIVGAINNPTKVYYRCAKCSEEITMNDIRAGRWVAEHPDRSSDCVGFHISQMMTFEAEYLYKLFRDPQTQLLEFYRKRLGMPYELGEGSLEREDFLISCFDEPYCAEDGPDGVSRYYMGLDQGNELQVVIVKIPPGSQRVHLVRAELIPFDVGFPRVGQLMQLYKVRRCVGDANPNRHSMANLRKNLPGRVILADYVEQKTRLKIFKDEKKKYVSSVAINRTEGFDFLFESVRKGQWALPGNPPNLDPMTELFIDHMTALRRDIETRKTPSGKIQVGVYRNVRPDHFAHAALYAQCAIEVDKGKKFRAVTVGTKEDNEPSEETEDSYKPSLEIIRGIIYYLAEVPVEQLSEYILRRGQEDYEQPFPLYYKLGLALDTYGVQDVDWVILDMINKHLKRKE